MKDKILFFITSEYPYGKGETFIDDEIRFLADVFDKIIIVPTIPIDSKRRNIPLNAVVSDFENNQADWLKTFSKIASEPKIQKEFFSNLFSNPLKNKILLKSVKNSLTIADRLKTYSEEYKSAEKVYYSYWLDDGAIAAAFLNDDSIRISRSHGWDVYFELHKHNYLPLRDFLSERLERIFTISENGKDYLDKKTGRPEKITISRLGTSNENVFDERSDYSKLNVISIGNLIPLKRINLIASAIGSCGNENITWNHFGEGILLDEIKSEFPFGIFHGHVGNEKIKEFLRANAANSVLVNTSSTEGIPVSMMEAMSFGIPCLGTKVGGVSEIIKDGFNGFLMPSDLTAETVAEYIKKFINLPDEEKNSMRRNAYKIWNEFYNADKNYSDFAARISALISR